MTQSKINDYQQFYSSYLGKPNNTLSSGQQIRWGKKGSFTVNITNGLWTNFENGDGGNAYEFLINHVGLSKEEATKLLSDDKKTYKDTQFSSNDDQTTINNKKGEDQAGIKTFDLKSKKVFNPVKEKEEEKRKKYLLEQFIQIHSSNKLLQDSQELQDYLIKKRRLDLATVFEMDSIRAFKDSMSIGLNQDYSGLLVGYQLKKFNKKPNDTPKTYLNNNYEKEKAYFSILNWTPQPEIIGICEGVETGLSILALKKEQLTMLCCLTTGNMSKLALDKELLKKTKEIRIYGDNDEAGIMASESCYYYLLKAKDIFSLTFRIKAIEYPINNLNDFNDVLNLPKK